MVNSLKPGPIGVFDSGIGGLTVLREIATLLPDYDYLYLGDNARAPYGTRSMETVYEYTLQGVDALFERGCHLVILACNTASANALRTIQQRDLEERGTHKRVLGVIRPTTERLSELSSQGHLGLMATEATVASNSYVIEAEKYAAATTVHQQACPMLVPLIENEEQNSDAAAYFIEKYVKALLEQSSQIDAVLLACTHYPIIYDQIKAALPRAVRLYSQGHLVAQSLSKYLDRHPKLAELCSKGGQRQFLTTDDPRSFESHARPFFEAEVQAEHIKF